MEPNPVPYPFNGFSLIFFRKLVNKIREMIADSKKGAIFKHLTWDEACLKIKNGWGNTNYESSHSLTRIACVIIFNLKVQLNIATPNIWEKERYMHESMKVEEILELIAVAEEFLQIFEE
jgi:hypothetical protein